MSGVVLNESDLLFFLEAEERRHRLRRTDMFTKSDRYLAQYPELPFGLVRLSGCLNPINPPGFDAYKRKLLRKMRRKDTLPAIRARIEHYDRFFKRFHRECPLPKHLERTIHSGFPRYNLIVDTHFLAEMCAGILVAAADHEAFEGRLTLDVADAGEVCRGMGNRELVTEPGEIVLRDEKEIVCILSQGADEKTRVRPETRQVAFYAYGVPGIDEEPIRNGLELTASTMERFGGGSVTGFQIA